MKQALKIIIGSALVTAAVIKAVPALAETNPPQNVSIVRTADLDLSSDKGRRQLDQRLVVAAREVCGTASDVDLAGQNAARQCRVNVLADARAKSGALVASRGGDRTILIAASR
jgi:UrcA family protein